MYQGLTLRHVCGPGQSPKTRGCSPISIILLLMETACLLVASARLFSSPLFSSVKQKKGIILGKTGSSTHKPVFVGRPRLYTTINSGALLMLYISCVSHITVCGCPCVEGQWRSNESLGAILGGKSTCFPFCLVVLRWAA